MGNLYIIISVLLNVVGQTLLKAGVNKLGLLSLDFNSILAAVSSMKIWGGLAIYGVSSVFWILALSNKDLSYAYPMLSIGYLVIIMVSWLMLKEDINLIRISGVILISLGLLFVFKSA